MKRALLIIDVQNEYFTGKLLLIIQKTVLQIY